MRRRKLIYNVISDYGSKIVSILCSFILPRLILSCYGSDVNGLISSITQFLAVVSLTDMGITVVVQSSLYEPLANKDNDEVSRILASASRFYKFIAVGLVIYTVALCFFLPTVADVKFDKPFVVTLILILSVDSLAQYIFGITKSQLLCADQKKYIVSTTSTATRLINTLLCVILIKCGCSIHIVKITTMLCYLVNPIVYSFYVKHNYDINWRIDTQGEHIKQKWNGVAQHITSYVYTNTDIIILTILSSIKNVSIYSIYNMVLNGINQLLSAFGGAMQPLMGEYWAKGDKKRFKEYFLIYEHFIQLLGIFFYGCTIVLIVPFVLIYTRDVNDTNYQVPIFSFIITLASLIQFLRTPYGSIISAVGHFKQTQTNYIQVAIINIVISVIAVVRFGLVGVAVGTLVSSVYLFAWQGWYIHCKLICESMITFWLQILKLVVIFVIGLLVTSLFPIKAMTYSTWVVLAVEVALIWSIAIIVLELIFNKKEFMLVLEMIQKIFNGKA